MSEFQNPPVTHDQEPDKPENSVEAPDSYKLIIADAAAVARKRLSEGTLAEKMAIHHGYATYGEIQRIQRLTDDPQIAADASAKIIGDLELQARTARESARVAELEAVATREVADRANFERTIALMQSQELSARLELAQKLAGEDILTGAGNRRKFTADFEAEYARARRHRRPLSLAAVDGDLTKYWNDIFSHLVGDYYIQESVAIMREQGRTSDLAYRFGGDEYMLLLPDTTPEETVTVARRVSEVAKETLLDRVKNRLRIDIETYEQLKQRALETGENFTERSFDTRILDHEGQMTLSIGVAGMNADENIADTELQHRADVAGYNAKYGSGVRQFGKVVAYTEGMTMPDKDIIEKNKTR